MHFPLEGCFGKRVPFWSLILGHSFRQKLNRKRHPSLGPDSGMQFPLEGLFGKYVPF